MRCPKCGAFLDPGKDVCFMCGVNVKTYVPDNNSFAVQSQNKDFGSGSQFSTPGGGFNNQNRSGYGNQQDWNSKPSENKALAKAQEKDIFDFYAEHKTVIRIFLLFFVVLILLFSGYKYYEYRTKPVPIVPVVQDLYFEIDDNFENVSGGSGKNNMFYTLTGEKGNDCSINIDTGVTSSDNYVEEFFETTKTNLNPELDKEGNVIDPMKIYSSQENSITINNTKWYYLNIFYRKDLDSDFNILKYKYMIALNKGYYYRVILSNNTNSNTCNAGLDNFVKSLEFVESSK